MKTQQVNMDIEEYPMEELLELVGRLSEKYTGKTSTSVSYDTAEQLMGAVLYCIDEYRYFDGPDASSGQLQKKETISLQEAYHLGYQKVCDKVYAAKELYHQVIQDFDDYQCQNYRDTIRKGIPAFFMNYDAKFSPQDHKLTLDYPAIRPVNHLSGVDAIYEYLCNIQAENTFLKLFPVQSVENLLWSIQSEYKKLYLDNICNAVLERALLCMIADRPVKSLKLEEGDASAIMEFLDYTEEFHDIEDRGEVERKSLSTIEFEPADADMGNKNEMDDIRNRSMKQAAVRLGNLAKHMLKSICSQSAELQEYFSCESIYADYAVRLQWRLTERSLNHKE